ncbi:MAG: SRPBCC family protein [Haloarculaceae archaeon]
MRTYERSVRVAAPLSTVWEFHSRIEGLESLTPSPLHLRVESVRGPAGEPDPDVLAVGTEIRMSMQPAGVGPRLGWTSHIRARDRGDGSAYFVDDMEDGPFRAWEHTHLFYADGDETVVRDRLRYQLPFGCLGRAAGPLGALGFEPMFRYRHRRTRELLE